MNVEQMKQALASRKTVTKIDTTEWDAAAFGAAHGEALAHAADKAMDLGNKAIDYVDGLWTGFKYARAVKAGEIS